MFLGVHQQVVHLFRRQEALTSSGEQGAGGWPGRWDLQDMNEDA